MKQLDIHSINQLLSIIDIYPSIRILHFSHNQPNLNSAILKLAQTNNYEFQLNSTTTEDYEYSIEKFKGQSNISILNFNLNRPKYNTQAKLYDYLFVSNEIEDKDRLKFLRKSHMIIKNAGLIVIFIPKMNEITDYDNIYRWSSLLEESYFVATNSINLSPHFDVIISKKMHGWGG